MADFLTSHIMTAPSGYCAWLVKWGCVLNFLTEWGQIFICNHQMPTLPYACSVQLCLICICNAAEELRWPSGAFWLCRCLSECMVPLTIVFYTLAEHYTWLNIRWWRILVEFNRCHGKYDSTWLIPFNILPFISLYMLYGKICLLGDSSRR